MRNQVVLIFIAIVISTFIVAGCTQPQNAVKISQPTTALPVPVQTTAAHPSVTATGTPIVTVSITTSNTTTTVIPIATVTATPLPTTFDYSAYSSDSSLPTPAPAGVAAQVGSPGSSQLSSIGENGYNLQQANWEHIAVPTVVDINGESGNILVRGPLPLVFRNGPGNSLATAPYLNQSESRFAYDELNGFIRNGSSPAYFNDSQRDHLSAALQAFDLADYQLIDISLIYNVQHEKVLLDEEKQAFGGNFSTCTEPLKAGTIHGQKGYLIWSPLGTATTCMNISCANPVLYNNAIYNSTGQSCSLIGLIGHIDTLMNEQDPSGKKRLIYYHCLFGKDRTGAVTISYLLQGHPDMSYCQALQYAEYLGQTSPPPQYFNGATVPLPVAQNLVQAYCAAINGRNCSICTP